MEIIKHKDKFYLKTETGYKEVIATTDISLKLINLSQLGKNWLDVPLPQPSQQFIEKFIAEYNKGNTITDVLVEYELDEEIAGYEYYTLKVNPKDNTITIKEIKESWDEFILRFHTTTDNTDRAHIGNYMSAFKTWCINNNYEVPK